MATTPPLQIYGSPSTPQTPLHGAAYDRLPARQSSRIRQRVVSQQEPLAQSQAGQDITSTPRRKRVVTSPPTTARPSKTSLQSPRSTPRKPTRRVQVVSPDSPNTQISSPKPVKMSNSHLQPFASSTTAISDSMLPTPVKTPKKKTVPNVNAAARALFQDAEESQVAGPSPRRGRKPRRYNGFSLESFSASTENNPGRVQIFTDNRDKVPEVDTTESNPFIDQPVKDVGHAKRVVGGSKRRKVSGEKMMDPQVAEAIKSDNAMVYVFRGRKVYRRLEDDEEEEIDMQDAGLLEYTANRGAGVRPLKTLTRKSIKPTRLFQSEIQKQAREREKEEEALTDIETGATSDSSKQTVGGSGVKDHVSSTKKVKGTKGKSDSNKESLENGKTTSPFNNWQRIKSVGSQDVQPATGRKRPAAEAVEDVASIEPVATSSKQNLKRSRG